MRTRAISGEAAARNSHAVVAQLEEHRSASPEAAGSSPAYRSLLLKRRWRRTRFVPERGTFESCRELRASRQVTVLFQRRGHLLSRSRPRRRSSSGRTPRWYRGGCGFDPHRRL